MSVAAPTLTGTHVQLEQLSREFAEELADGGQRRPVHVRLDPGAADGRWDGALHQRLCSTDQRARTAVPFVQRRRQRRRAGRLHPLPTPGMVGRQRPARRGRDRRHVAGRLRAAHAHQHRGQVPAAEQRVRPVERAPRLDLHRRAQQRRAEPRSCGSAPRSRESCAVTEAPTRPASRTRSPAIRRCTR